VTEGSRVTGGQLVRVFLFFIVFIVSFEPASIAKPQDTACVVDKYGQYAATQEQWQRDLTKLVLSVRPEYSEVANLYLVDQLHRIELWRIAVEFMAWHAPEKLNLDSPLNQWISLDSLSEEEIAKADKRYSDLLRLTKHAHERPSHPDGDALRKVMREEVIHMPTYKALAERFTASVAKIEGIACK
jgi:hypothetical protein